jgi:hypothetical protein
MRVLSKSATRATRLRISQRFQPIAILISNLGERFPLCFLDVLHPLQFVAIDPYGYAS